jgi:hypothetical protein
MARVLASHFGEMRQFYRLPPRSVAGSNYQHILDAPYRGIKCKPKRLRAQSCISVRQTESSSGLFQLLRAGGAMASKLSDGAL